MADSGWGRLTWDQSQWGGSTVLATGWGTLTSLNYGAIENLISVKIEEDTEESWSLEAAGVFADASGAATDLLLRVNGGLLVTVAKAGLDTISNAKTNINAALNTELGTVAKAYVS